MTSRSIDRRLRMLSLPKSLTLYVINGQLRKVLV